MAHLSQPPGVGYLTTTILIGNLHCASCLSHIQEILATRQLASVSITTSYRSHEIVITHPPKQRPVDIALALSEAEIEIQSVRTRDQSGNSIYEQYGVTQIPKTSPPQAVPHPVYPSDTNSPLCEEKVKHCATCQRLQEKVNGSGDVTLTIREAPKSTASLSIVGMTCAACILSIKEGVDNLQFLEDISVSLLTNSATVVFTGPKENLDEIIERIEERGFDCDIENILETGAQEREHEQAERTVMISIKGMFCDRCPQRILDALSSSFPGLLAIDTSPTFTKPVMKVTYQPQHDIVTIRSILAAIHGVDDRIEATIYHPLTIEERSQAMQLRERRRLLLRLLFSFIVAIPTFLISVVWTSLVPSTNHIRIFFQREMWGVASTRSEWALFFLATPVMFLAADVFHTRAIKEIRALWGRNSRVPILRRFYRFGSMNLLMSAGTSMAYFPSIAVLGLSSQKTRERGQHMSTYFDAVVFLTMFILAGRYLEAYSKSKAGDAVTLLRRLRPEEALLVNSKSDSKNPSGDGKEADHSSDQIERVNVDLLEVGDVIRVPSGASPPADGIVILGESTFDESSLTGESRPIRKRASDQVFSGTVNTGNAISIQATEIPGTSMLDQIVKVVREGQTKRAPVERVADTLTGYFVPFITLLATSAFVIWFGLGQGGVLPATWLDSDVGGWTFWALQFAVAVFVGACPCGIALAAPTALFVGSGLAAQHGILVKGGGEAFQEASTLDVVVFDKTGTLTAGGSPSVSNHRIMGANVEDAKIIVAITQALEDSSNHPVAKAIAQFCVAQDRAAVVEYDVEEIPGRGLRGKFTVRTSSDARFEAAIGNEVFISSLGVLIDANCLTTVSNWKTAGKSIALMALRTLDSPAVNEPVFRVAALFATSDPLRPEAPFVVSTLQKQGLSVWMISGDNVTTATAVGLQVGIPVTNIIAGVLPAEKADKIRWLQSSALKRKGKSGRAIVAMIGDGINDAPALTAADAGIAIGSGSDIAISSAKFVLISSSLYNLLTLVTLSRTVFRRVKFNFFWALVYNIILLPIAAGVIYPAHGHPRLNPVWASLAMALSSLSVVCSSLIMRTGLPVVGFRATTGEAQISSHREVVD